MTSIHTAAGSGGFRRFISTRWFATGVITTLTQFLQNAGFAGLFGTVVSGV